MREILLKGFDQSRVELALLALIGVVCVGLSVLQYRWTGDVSRAERGRLGSGLAEQTGRLARAFQEELSENCKSLLPSVDDIQEQGFREAHQTHFQEWSSSHDSRLFARIGVAVPESGVLNLYSFDGQGKLIESSWPAGWESMRAAMAARIQGEGSPPSAPQDLAIIEIPVFRGSSGGRRGSREEQEWMIFEVSGEHIRRETLPRLVGEYLNAGNEALYDVSATWAKGEVVFSTRSDGASVVDGADLKTGIFSARVDDAPPGRGGRRRFRGEEASQFRWTLAVRHREGSLDAAVLRSRVRNLVMSLVLIGLLGGAAWALVRLTARSRRLAESQFRFAVGVSHDLRTPLTSIRGAAFNLASGVVTEPASIGRYGKMILRNAEELTSMIENVLAYSASMHKGREERRESFAIGDLVEHAASALTEEAAQAGCSIEVTVAPDLPALAGDGFAIEHAFRNLIANAARHASQGKWIGVSAARYEGGVEVRVCDRGPGIPEEERARIFEPFYRSEHTRASHVRGTGLGLSLVKETVVRHGGTIEVRNADGGGAEFTVRLPASSEVV